MTGILSNQLPGRANPPDADNPLGSFKDRTAPGANDGSYLTQTWANDRNSLLQALFIASGLTPNGVEDTGTASQLFDALVNNRWSSIGNYLPGTVVTASDGNQYYCVNSNGRDSSVVNPVGDVTDTWRQYPAKITQDSNSFVVEHFDGRVDFNFVGGTSNSSGVSVCNFPAGITLSDSNYRPQLTEISGSPTPSLVGIWGVVIDSKTQTGFNAICISPDGTARQDENPYITVSYRKA